MSSSPIESTAPGAAPTASGGNGTPVAKPAGAPRVPLFSAEAWAPLKVELFRSLYIATSVAQVGTWVREAGGPWLMKLLTDGRHDQPRMVALVLLFSNLPICLFSVFAGALADVLDRRRLLIVTQAWMMVVSALLGVLTWSGHISPWSLLGLTFLVGAGTAAAGPALQALLPELVPRSELPLAINLNSVALNVARALGPAMFIIVIELIPGRHGVGASFLVTALSFVAAIWVLVKWQRPPQRAAVHGEEMWGAIRSGFLYNLHSPANRAILLRVFTFIVPAVVMWSQVPMIATGQLGLQKEMAEKGSAMLFAFVGLGAIFGVLIMPGLQKRYRIDPVVNVCTACFAAGLILLSFVHHLWLAAFLMVFLGINWVIIPTNFNTATQTSVPMWVKGRAISFYLTVLFGSFTVGAALWGNLTTHFGTPTRPDLGISTSLLIGGISMAALLVLARWYPLTLNKGLDLAPAGNAAAGAFPDFPPPTDPNAGPLPADAAAGMSAPATSAPPAPVPLGYASASQGGPVDVVVEYDVEPTTVAPFLATMRRVGELRRRNGATRWRLEAADAPAGAGCVRYAERFRFHSAAEYARQPARMTAADAKVLAEAHGHMLRVDPQTSPAARMRVAPADPADNLRASATTWAIDTLADSIDRTFDEAAAMFDRFSALKDRERKSRTPRYREVTIRIPE